jgi:hypothetical protein
MRKWSAFGLGVLFLLVSAAANAGTREVQGTATGRYYNDVWKSWSKEPISVYIDDKGNTYINGGESLIFARGFLYARERTEVIELLKKGLKWAKTAKKEKVEITKELGSFMKSGSFDQYGVKLTFFSSNKGQQTDVILYMVDFDNMFNKITLYLNPTQVKSFIKLLEKVPQTLKELQEYEKKSKMFK